MEFACNVSPVVRFCEPQPCRRRDLRAVPVLLAMEAGVQWSGRKILFSEVIDRVERVETCRASTCSTWLNKMQGRGGLATSVAEAGISPHHSCIANRIEARVRFWYTHGGSPVQVPG